MPENHPRYYEIGTPDRPRTNQSGDLSEAMNTARTYNPQNDRINSKRPVIPTKAENIPDTFPEDWLELDQ